MFIHWFQVCLEQSIFIFLGLRSLRKQSENTHRALTYSRSLKYCVLLAMLQFLIKSKEWGQQRAFRTLDLSLVVKLYILLVNKYILFESTNIEADLLSGETYLWQAYESGLDQNAELAIFFAMMFNSS